MKNSETIKKLGLVFPPSPKPLGIYRPTLVVDRFYMFQVMDPSIMMDH